jgi:hypothetical protein
MRQSSTPGNEVTTMYAACLSTTLILLGPSAVRADDPVTANAETVRSAVKKAVPLMVKGSTGHIAQRACFACHNQAVPMLALTTARERGFDVQAADQQEQTKHIAKFLASNREGYLKGKGQGGLVDTASYALWTLELAGWQPDATTEAVAEYLLLHHKDLDAWRSVANRPPSEASHFTVNYFALRGLQKWGTPQQKDRIAKKIDGVRSWLLKTPAKDTEDRVFRLWALQAAGLGTRKVRQAVGELMLTQRQDGGWGQLDGMDSDAYATGSALVVLHQAGGLATEHPAYQRGLVFLLKSQRDDGSWLVRSRSKPFQPYYESGFPHGKDQFISMAASAWATTALALACPPR